MPRKAKPQPSKRRTGVRKAKSKPAADRGPGHWLQSVFEHSSLGIALLDPAARIIEANAAFEQLLGRRADELAGHAVREFAAAEDAEAIISLVSEVGAGQRSSTSREVAKFRRTQVCPSGPKLPPSFSPTFASLRKKSYGLSPGRSSLPAGCRC